MHILLVGAGGREHSLAWKIAKSPLVKQLTCTPGNPGMVGLGPHVDLKTSEIVAYAKEHNVDLVVVGPEAPLAEGLGDDLRAAGIPCFGPEKEGAQLETSKSFLKDICRDHDIPAPRSGRFEKADEAIAFLDQFEAPYVVKADGLAAGKGVVIAQTRSEAEQAIHDMLAGQFGDASKVIVIEEFLEGTELSFFALTDSEVALPFGGAQDHKRAFDNDEGLNTGGMGGFSPSPLHTPELEKEIMTRIIAPTMKALKDKGIDYRGVFYAGLIITKDGPKIIEYNCRFGDPECQILMRRLRSDIVPPLWGAATGRLAGVGLDWMTEAAANIVYATKGYPEAYENGSAISGIDKAEEIDEVVVFHAGTKLDGETLKANGGRVLNVTALGDDQGQALNRAYDAAGKIDWPEGYYRTDIGKQFR